MSSVERTTSDRSAVRVLFSAAWQHNIDVDALDDRFVVRLEHRSVDYGLRGARRHLTYLLDSLRILRGALSHDVTVISSAGFETFVTPLLWTLVPAPLRRHRFLVILDPIVLRWRRLDPLFAVGLRRVAKVLCIRSGDVATYGRRFGVPPARCAFFPMPVPTVDVENPGDARDGNEYPYVYAGGSSHRDWPVLLAAFARLPERRCVLATGLPQSLRDQVPPNVVLAPANSVEDGRRLMSGATLVAVPFQDTELACGPTHVLDAYAFGLPVIATDTNACRDYVRDGSTGLLSAPGDADALAANVEALMSDPQRRRQMSSDIRELARGPLSRARFEESLAAALAEVTGR
jgi:glycosyltransferase involved in cell wall biosynthesis